ncbi:MAG: SGNH/GDSL hydrolase family protein, partial [Colwellia sp.]
MDKIKMNLVLIGDSILDNNIYVSEGKSVSNLLEPYLPAGANLIKLAVDGATSYDTLTQVNKLPKSVTHAVVSVGGNDALKLVPLLFEDSKNLNSALTTILPYIDRFRYNLSRILECLDLKGINICILNIYNSIPNLEAEKKLILSMFNDVISEEATLHSVPIVDLRTLLRDDLDFSNISPLEPSEIGGKKIVNEVIR